MSDVPIKLKGKEFETLLLDAARREEEAGILTMDRYGVECSVFGGKTVPIESKPDFEGITVLGRQFIIEAKANSQASFQMYPTVIKAKQVKHMLTRSRFNAWCFLVIHFNERILKNAVQPAFTSAIPVNDENPRWQRYVDACAAWKREKRTNPEAKLEPQGSITRDEAQETGTLILWRVPDRCRKALPDIARLIMPDTSLQAPAPIQTTLFNETPQTP